MKTTGKYKSITIDYETRKPIISFLLNSNITSVDEIKDVDLLDIEVKKHRLKRSLDANAYCWVLIGKLAEKLNMKSEEIYKFEIKEIGVYEILPIKNDAVLKFKEAWGKNGIGWICEELGKSKIDGYTNLKVYYGSSTYNSKEMSMLIDSIVEDCKMNGIETFTPAELQKLKEMWK